MPAFDASSVIHAWDNYPLNQFPPLWNWLGAEIEAGRLVMSNVAFQEVKDKAPDCATWLEDNDIQRVQISNEMLQKAMAIKASLDIENDNYHAKGVDENDVLIIASAAITNEDLISDEAQQATPPQIKAKMKIPTVCNLPEVGVQCISFIEYIRASGAVFQ